MEENKKNTENKTIGRSANSASTQTAKENNSPENNTENQSNSTENDVVSQVSGILHGDTSGVKDLYSKAKESGEQVAGQVLKQAKEKASSAIGEQKSNLAAGLGSVADGIRQVGGNLRDGDDQNSIVELTAKYGDSLAQQVEKLSNYLDRKDVRDMARDVEVFARRNPAIFIGAAFALGFLAVRFLKSSNPHQTLTKSLEKGKSDENKHTKA